MPGQTPTREDAWTFLCGATEHWRAIVGGSLVFLALGVAASLGFNVPPIISGVSALCLAVSLACFLCWRDEHAKIIALTRPNLRGHIVSIGIGGTKHGTALTILLQITNTGPPTIADSFTVMIGSRQYPTVYLPPNAKFSDNAGNVVEIHPADMLYEKLRERIPENDRVSGFLFFIVKDISPSEFTKSAPPSITVRFCDASLKEYSATSSGSGQAQPLYEPGVNDPFISLYSGRQQKESEAEKKAKERRRRKGLAERLAILMDRGRVMAETLRDFNAETRQPTQEEMDDWAVRVYCEFAAAPSQAIYVARFNAARDVAGTALIHLTMERSRDYKYLMSKVNVLGEFIKELTQPL